MSQKCRDVSAAEFLRVPPVVEKYEATNPADILLLGAVAIVAYAHRVANPIEKADVMRHDA